MWLARRVKKIHLLCSIVLLAVVLLALSLLQLADLLYAQRQNSALNALPIEEALDTNTEKPEFFTIKQKGSRANYSSVEADDLINMLKVFFPQSNLQFNVFNETEGYSKFLRDLNIQFRNGSSLKYYLKLNSTTSWAKFYKGINQYYLYQPDDISDLLTDLNRAPIATTEEVPGQGYSRLLFTLQNGETGIFTPKRLTLRELHPDSYFKTVSLSHSAEIAAFHLDRLLGLYKVPPTVGRIVNITSDVMLLAKGDLRNQFFISQDGSICFQGSCRPHCPETCASPELLHGSMSITLPLLFKRNPLRRERHPMIQILSNIKKTKFDKNFKYCHDNVKTRRLYTEAPTPLLEVIEISIFDFLIDNMNRPSITRYRQFGNNTFILHNDNGRGFAKAKRDCSACLLPLQQCCMIRMSTLLKLVKLYLGPTSLSQVMRSSLKDDPLAPVLLDTHLNALDRRLGKILKVVKRCLNGVKFFGNVLIDDIIK